MRTTQDERDESRRAAMDVPVALRQTVHASLWVRLLDDADELARLREGLERVSRDMLNLIRAVEESSVLLPTVYPDNIAEWIDDIRALLDGKGAG
jgi:hypothetical protein